MRFSSTCKNGLTRTSAATGMLGLIRNDGTQRRPFQFSNLHPLFSTFMVAVLFPHFDHLAIEERYASWQARTLLRSGGAVMHGYSPEEKACDAAAPVDSDRILVITDPLVLASPRLPERLAALLDGPFDAVVPVTNEPANAAQQRTLQPYVTVRELQMLTAVLEGEPPSEPRSVVWDGADPYVFACRIELLDSGEVPMRNVLRGKTVGISMQN